VIILLLGKDGQVGWELQRTLLPVGEVIALGRKELDLTNSKAISETIKRIHPNLIVNAAAYTNVEKAEDESDLAYTVNTQAPALIAKEAFRIGASMIHYSTDYVFDGVKNNAYTEEDLPNPINVYGKSKLEGEKAVISSGCAYLILRTSWVYSLRRNNFLRTMLNLANDKKQIRVVSDQYGCPTWGRFVAEATAIIISKNPVEYNREIYHLSCKGKINWYKFAEMIFKLSNIEIDLTPITTDEYQTVSKRPQYSYLSTEKIKSDINIEIPDWLYCLELALKNT
jgi:dTDP-4-dehydrorhamnose reductase